MPFRVRHSWHRLLRQMNVIIHLDFVSYVSVILCYPKEIRLNISQLIATTGSSITTKEIGNEELPQSVFVI